MGVVTLIAYFTPFLGKNGGVFHAEITANYIALVIIFLLTGLGIRLSLLKTAALNIKHQLSNFFF